METKSKYVKCLLDKVNLDPMSKLMYVDLFKELANLPYIPKHPMDEHRALDGIALRAQVPEGLAPEYPNCTMLELLIALALRMEDDTMGNGIENRSGMWLMCMLENMLLVPYCPAGFDQEFVDRICSEFIQNNYAPNGQGGPFYIPDYKYDIRLIPLWMQAQAWMAKADRMFN